MGLIYKEVVLRGDKGARRSQALWDNGASESFIRRDLAEKVGTIVKLSAPRQFEMGKGTLLVEESTGIVDLEVEGYSLFWHFLCVPELSEELIIGADFLQRWKIKLDPENEKLIIDPKALRLKLVKQSVIAAQNGGKGILSGGPVSARVFFPRVKRWRRLWRTYGR